MQWQTFRVEGETVTFGDRIIAVGESIGAGLGSIALRKTEKSGLHMVRLSNSGRFVYTLKLPRNGEYRMGPKWGHRVKQPAEEVDPILRVCREIGIPISQVKIIEAPSIDGAEVTVGGSYCGHSTEDSNFWYALHTDGEPENATEPERVEWHQNRCHIGCVRSTWQQVVKGGTWAIITLRKTRYFAGIREVVVARGVDLETFRRALKGDGNVEEGRLRLEREAAEEKGGELEWLAKYIKPGEDAWHAIIGKEEYHLFCGHPCVGDSDKKIVASQNQYPGWGSELINAFNGIKWAKEVVKVLPPKQLEYVLALLDKESAIKWLSTECQLYRYAGKLWTANKEGALWEIDPTQPAFYGPSGVLYRHKLGNSLERFSRELSCPINAEYFAMYPTKWAHEAHVNATGKGGEFLAAWQEIGTDRRFVLAGKSSVDYPDRLGVCRAAEGSKEPSAVEDPGGQYVWHLGSFSDRGEKNLQIWRI